MHLLRMDELEQQLPRLAAEHLGADPFPHTVLDDLLAPGVLEQLVAEHDAIPEPTWSNFLHLNERKYANKQRSTWGPTLQQVTDAFASERFLRFVEELTGIPGLRSDPVMDGGGLHRSLRGGFLNVHSDFTVHHDDRGLQRRVNLLLYLNPEWQEDWGGALELWSPDMQRCTRSVLPMGGRAVLFTTTETSFHGHPIPLRCPDDAVRRSLALYYFTTGADVRVRSTQYRARPGDGIRGVGIYLDTRALRVYDVARRRLGLRGGLVNRAAGWVARRRGR